MTLWRKLPPMSQGEWLVWRGKGIGGSDAPAIMGVSPWATPCQKWEEKVYDIRQEDNASKKFGRDTEKGSRMEFEDLIGLKMDPCNIENIEFPWMRASLDGISRDDQVIVEIKKTNKEDHRSALEGKVPEKYYPQCQHILMTTGLSYMYYFSSPASGTGVIVRVDRNNSYIVNELFPKEKEFMEMVLNRKPPSLTEKDVNPMENSAAWEAVSERWKYVNNSLKSLEKEEEYLKNEMIRLAGGNAKGNGVSLKFEEVKGRIDYEAAINDYICNMKAHYPDVDFKPISYDPYRKNSFIKWTARDIE